MENGLSLGDAIALSDRRHSDDCGFGGGYWIWFILIFLIFGWGRRDNNLEPMIAAEGRATRSEVASGFQFNQLDNGIRATQNGLCDGFYAINNALKDGFYATTSSQKDCC